MRQTNDAYPVPTTKKPKSSMTMTATGPGVDPFEFKDGHLTGTNAFPSLHLRGARVAQEGLYNDVLTLITPTCINGNTTPTWADNRRCKAH
mmetsp:Transcript_115125/g.320742  ORF Transcript_115125/g.320742 Transcript_115125/m.320742 type:complete len:91 (+) Transcript_115125:2019-2291(+)